MKSATHDAQMTAVYGHIYEPFYGFAPEAMAGARRVIGKNLAEMGVEVDDLSGMQVLNVGTGREAVVFAELGAAAVYHYDVSPRPVQALRALAARDGRFGAIRSRQVDLCEADGLEVPGGVDLVYLSGVLHHLHDAGAAMERVLGVLNAGARLFFRIYRSGCLAFFVVDFVRRFVTFADRERIDGVFREAIGPIEEHRVLYDDMYDDFFVPVLRLYDPAAVDGWFAGRGFEPMWRWEGPVYDHGDARPEGQGVSLAYRRIDGNPGQQGGNGFARHVDQLRGIRYAEPWICRTVEMMEAFLAMEMPQDRRLATALRLYEASQLYRRGGSTDARREHERLQAILDGAMHGD